MGTEFKCISFECMSDCVLFFHQNFHNVYGASRHSFNFKVFIKKFGGSQQIDQRCLARIVYHFSLWFYGSISILYLVKNSVSLSVIVNQATSPFSRPRRISPARSRLPNTVPNKSVSLAILPANVQPDQVGTFARGPFSMQLPRPLH